MKKTFLSFILAGLVFTSCDDIGTDLDIENFNNPGYNEVLSNPNDLESILLGAYTSAVSIHTSSNVIGYLLHADQLTTTNNYAGFWQFAHQPRKQYVNSPTSDLRRSSTYPWGNAYSAIRGANHIIRWIEGDKKPYLIGGVDKSESALASAYFVKGMAEGSLASIYDKGYIVNHDSSVEELKVLKTNAEILTKALEDIDKAISLTNAASASFVNTYFINGNLNKAKFLEIMNSFAARILISSPASKQDASSTDFARVLSYANKGLTSDFKINTKLQVWWSSIIDWAAWYYAAFDSAYLQADIKIQHLMDSSYPKDYPDTGVLAPATSTDPRTSYFTYGTSFGFLNAARDRSLFSNYRSSRWNNATNNIGGDPNYQNPIFLKAEVDYIKAEATLKGGGGAAAAAAILNSSARKTIGGITTGTTYAEVLKALHYEYAVELQLSGSAITQWSFMKRNDLLQKGSFTMMPIPASELEAQGITTVYTFGGDSGIGNAGTASTEGWKVESSYNQ